VTDDASSEAVLKGFQLVPGLVEVVNRVGLAPKGDSAVAVGACELVLESLVARKKISRNDAGQYGRAVEEKRRRPEPGHVRRRDERVTGGRGAGRRRGGGPMTQPTPPDTRPPASDLRIRPATRDDLETVVALRLSLLEEHRDNPVYNRRRPDAPARARRLFASQLDSGHETTFLPSGAARRSGSSGA
jgi:hypothetical protein